MTSSPVPPPRLLSLDAFRGLTIAGMILVNNPGSWEHIYPPLEHAEWNGWTPTDLIFPFFVFIVGVAMTFSIGRRMEAGDGKAALWRKILLRSLVIILIGLLLNGFPSYDLTSLRYAGVLQRIGLVYLVAGTVYLASPLVAQYWITGILLLGYWAVMVLVAVPGYGAGVLAPEGNLAQYLDNLVLHGHMWMPTRDPEGMLSTIPAVASCLLGTFAGRLRRSALPPTEKALRMFLWGNLGLLVGLVFDHWFPINKNLWTSSYVVLTAGLALQVLGVCYWLIDIRGHRRWAWPFFVFGANPLTVFVLSGVLARLMILWTVMAPNGTRVSLKGYLWDHLFLPLGGLLNGSLLFALANVLFWLAVMTLFYRRRWLIRV